MAKTLKWLAIGVVVLVALAAAAVAAVITLVDPNDYREEIAAAVEQQTGHRLHIDGPLELRFFPEIGLSVADVSLDGDPDFGEGAFAAVSQLNLGVALWPLFSGALELDTITLEGVKLRLVRNADGRANWERFTAPGPDADTSQPASPDAGGREPSAAPPASLPPLVRNARLAGVRVRQASVSYRDATTGTRAVVEPFNLRMTDVRLGAPVPLEVDWEASLQDGPAASGSLEANVALDADLASARVERIELEVTGTGGGIPGGEQTVSVRGRVSADLAAGTYRLRELRVDALGSRLTGRAEANLVPEGVTASGSVALEQTSPRDVMAALAIAPPETRDSGVLRSLAASAELRFANGVLRAQPLELTLDDTRVQGRASVRQFDAPVVGFELSANRMDVDRYLPPPSEGEEQAGTPGGAAAAGAGELPVETLRALNLDGRVTVDELKVSGLRASGIELVIKAEDGRVRLHPLNAALYGGRYEGDVRIDATGEEPRIQVDERLGGINAGPLLTDMADFDRLLGQANVQLTATTQGRQAQGLVEALQGEARFEFVDGVVRGINIAQMLRDAVARVRGESPGDAAAPKQTDFSSLSGTVRFDGGVARNTDFQAKTPLLRLNGDGRVNLIERSVDYNLTVNLVDSLEGQGGDELSALRRVPVPLRFRGPLTDPGIELAVGEALKRAARERAEEKVERKGKEVEKKLKEEAGERLRGIFGD